MTNVDKFIVERIEELCKRRNMTHYRLAEKSGVSQSTISNMTHGRNIPGISVLEKLCDAFGITLSQFFAGDDEKPDLTPEQNELIDTWAGLSDLDKARLRAYLDGMTGR